MSIDDSLLRSRPKTPSEIARGRPFAAAHGVAEQLREAVPETATAEASTTADSLPAASDQYAAYGRASNKPELTLQFLLKDASWEGFAYANLERISQRPADTPGGGKIILLRFAGSVVSEVKITGRNLNQLFAYLGQHRIPWVRELPERRDFGVQTAAEVVTAITVTELK